MDIDLPAKTEGDSDSCLLLRLPPELLLDDIIARLPSKDIFSLSRTSKLFHSLCKEPAVWRAKMHTDYASFAPRVALGSGERDSGWYERVYLGLERPRTYLWGFPGEARLGSMEDIAARTRAPRLRFVNKVDAPMDVSDWFAGSRTQGAPAYASGATAPAPSPTSTERSTIVDLQAAGWSFAALDSKGGVWVWGKLDSTTYRGLNDWCYAGTIVDEATRIPLPCVATQISTGRRHIVLLDEDNLVWEMTAWGKAFHHTAPQLTGPTQTGAASPTRGPYILQVEAGWNHSACLTAKGDIHVWRPFSFVSPPIPETDTSDDDDQYVDPNPPPAVEPTEPGSKLHGPLKTPEGRRFYWGTYPKDMVSTLLPIPERPAPPSDDAALVAVEKEFAQAAANASFSRMNEDQQREFTRAVKIACTEHGVLALRANGEVWLLSDIDSGDWQFLAHFSNPGITHITAQWVNFFTYRTSTAKNPNSAVIWGRCENSNAGTTTASTRNNSISPLVPRELPELADLNVILVVAGDWHYAALTADGALYTWGENGSGQCGLSASTASIERPTRVTFPPDGERSAFVFSVTAAGMHSGALVLGHPRGKDELPPILRAGAAADRGHDAEAEDDALNSPLLQRLGMRGIPGFRIGFAGRGARFGSGNRATVAMNQRDQQREREAQRQAQQAAETQQAASAVSAAPTAPAAESTPADSSVEAENVASRAPIAAGLGGTRGLPRFRIGFAGRGARFGLGNRAAVAMHEREAQQEQERAQQDQPTEQPAAIPLHAPSVGRVGLGNRATVAAHQQAGEPPAAESPASAVPFHAPNIGRIGGGNRATVAMHQREDAQQAQGQAQQEQGSQPAAVPFHAPNVGRIGLGNRATVAMHERQAEAQESQQQAEVEALAMPLHAPNVGRVGLGNRATVEMHRQQEEQEGKK